MTMSSSLYVGEVVHRRLMPVQHELRYRVYNLYADVDELPDLHRRLRTFSYNRPNLFSIRDRDHGSGDGTPIAEHAWTVVRRSAVGADVKRIFMFTYPRVLGYVFNPLTVYYGLDSGGQLRMVIYEVNNTFGQRHSYAVLFDGNQQPSCRKVFHVSPFNGVEGTYDFHATPPDDTLKLAISLSTEAGPCLTAWFAGRRRPLSDAGLLRSFLSLPLQPVKIIGGIHLEAAKLWLKGLKLRPRPLPPAENISFTITEKQK